MKLSKRERVQAINAYIFILPILICVVVFSILPVCLSFIMSLLNINSLSGFLNFKFVGLSNFKLILNDPEVISSFGKTALYTIIEVPLMVIGSLLIALALNKKLYMRKVSRTMILMPYVSTITVIALVFQSLLEPSSGPVNKILTSIGVQTPPQWLLSTSLVIPIAAVVYVYQNIAFQSLVFLAALQEVPNELKEAAIIDGAGKYKTFYHVVLPLISPTTFFIMVSSIIGGAQSYSIIAALTKGGPAGSSEVASYHIAQMAFSYNQYSLAAAQSVIFFLALGLITIFQWKFQKRWVNY